MNKIKLNSTIMIILIITFFFCYKIEAKNVDGIKINQDKEVNNKNASGIEDNLVTLNSSISKNTFTSYKDTAVVKYKIRFSDSDSDFKKGKLVIGFDKTSNSFEPVSFAKTFDENKGINSALFNRKNGQLVVDLNSKIDTGSMFEYSIVVRANAFIKDGGILKLNATLTGQDNNGKEYKPQSSIVESAVRGLEGFEMIDEKNSQWKWQGKLATPILTYSIKTNDTPEDDCILELMQPNAREFKSSFRNLKIVYEQVGDSSLEFAPFFNVSIGENQKKAELIEPNQTLIKSDSYMAEYGKINGFATDNILINIPKEKLKVPKDAKDGDTYKYKVSVYDEDNLLNIFYIININVNNKNTEISYESYPNHKEVLVNDYFDWSISSMINPNQDIIKDYTVTVNVPSGTRPVSLTKPSNSLNLIKNAEVYINEEWQKVMVKSGTQTFDLSSITEKIEKIRYVYNDIAKYSTSQIANDASIRFLNVSNPIKSKILVNVSSISYYDKGNMKNNLVIREESKSIDVVDSSNKADVLAYVSDGKNNSSHPFSTIQYNGASFKQQIKLINYQGQLEDPYLYVIAPEGLQVTNPSELGLFVPFKNGLYDDMSPDQNIIYPKSKFDIQYKTYQLSNNRTLHFWYLEDFALKGRMNLNRYKIPEVMAHNQNYKLVSVKPGLHNIVYGMGSLKTDDYNLSDNAEVEKLVQKNISDEIKSILPKIESSKVFTISRKIEVGAIDNLTTSMHVKGSEDTKYVDATSRNAHTRLGKETKYRLTIKNDGTSEIRDFHAIDILPHIGDELISNPNKKRGSEFNVNLGSSVKVLVDGVETKDVHIQYSKSTNPQRYNKDGLEIGEASWYDSLLEDESDMKSIKVSLLKSFKPNSKIEVVFSGLIPIDTPKTSKVAYNTISTYGWGQELGEHVIESTKSGVEIVRKKGGFKLGGLVYMDFNRNGEFDEDENGYNGVALNLYKKQDDGLFIKVDTIKSSSDFNNRPGKFEFINIDEGIYKIEAELNEHTSFITANGSSLEINENNKNLAWLKYNGETEFIVNDSNDEIIDFTVPFDVKTLIRGSIRFVDKNGDYISKTKYGSNFRVRLYNGEYDEIDYIESDSNGNFICVIDSTIIKNMKMDFIKPEDKNFVYSSFNNDNFDIKLAEYTLKNVEPGIGASADILITDDDTPTVNIKMDNKVSPKKISLSAYDNTSDTIIQHIIKLNGNQISKGSEQVTLPKEDGVYTIEAVAIDDAKNESKKKVEEFAINNTPPVISAKKEEIIKVMGSNKVNDLVKEFGIEGKDSIDGIIDNFEIDGTYNLDKIGTYKITFVATNSYGSVGKKMVSIKVIAPKVYGTVFEDANYNSYLDKEERFFPYHFVNLINKKGKIIETKQTNLDGTYNFNLPSDSKNESYNIQAVIPNGYILANYNEGTFYSKVNPKSKMTNSFKIEGKHFNDIHIGFGKNISASVVPLSSDIHINDTKVHSIRVTNGNVSFIKKSNNNIRISSVSKNKYVVNGVKFGNTNIVVGFKNEYNRIELLKKVKVNILKNYD